jgi:glutathione S-transferase
MQLVGMLDSPYVRRVAISLKRMGLPFEHRAVSVFRHYEQFRGINPLVKAPSLVCADGTVLCESSLILDYLEDLAGPGHSLMPRQPGARREVLRLLGLALCACEKTVSVVYELRLRPAEKQHQPWLDRVQQQLGEAYTLLEAGAARAAPYLLGTELTQADITAAVAWRFTQFVIADRVEAARYPALAAWSARMEQLPEFASTPLD